MPDQRRLLRKALRARRRALSVPERRRRSALVVRALLNSPLWHRTRRLGLFLPNDGEVDLTGLLPRAWAGRRTCCLPVLHGERLHFVPYRRGQCLRRNRFGIPEPAAPCPAGTRSRKGPGDRTSRRRMPVTALDLVLAPLVGFDGQGNRLGMGGGYYDRTFAYLRHRRLWRRPLLVGVAFELQRVPSLPVGSWDVPLDGVVTERGLHMLRGRVAGVPPSFSLAHAEE